MNTNDTPTAQEIEAALRNLDQDDDADTRGMRFYWYFAGKIAKNDWRHSIVGISLKLNDTGSGIPENKPIQIKAAHEGMEYVGPFFISCDHGCYHGPNRHGLFGTNRCYGIRFTRQEILEMCCEQISKAVVVFAWIDDLTCFGTLAEIGYAHALGKPVMLGMSQDFPDLWFAKQMACYCTIRRTAALAFQDCLKNL